MCWAISRTKGAQLIMLPKPPFAMSLGKPAGLLFRGIIRLSSSFLSNPRSIFLRPNITADLLLSSSISLLLDIMLRTSLLGLAGVVLVPILGLLGPVSGQASDGAPHEASSTI